MAGPFAHMLICQAAGEPGQVAAKLMQLLDEHQCYILLGSVAPDLPAIWDNVDSGGWSDKFHIGPNTNGVVLGAFEQLLSSGVADGRLAFILGYIAHIIADGVVHPVVNLAVKKRNDPKVHGEFERASDALLFKQIKKYELRSLDFIEWLEEVRSNRNRSTFDQTMQLWADQVKRCYGGSVDCEAWYFTFNEAVNLARLSPVQFRGVTFPPVAKISDRDKKDFYSNVPLPTMPETNGSFYDVVFDRAVTKVREVWSAAWDCWTNRCNLEGVVADYNLNTGENLYTHRKNDLWQ